MLVLKLELWPGGDRAKARDLGTLEIGNVGGDVDEGEYRCLLKEPVEPGELALAGCEIRGWRRANGAWALVTEALVRLLKSPRDVVR